MRPRFTTAPMEHSTGFGPLIALGFWVRQQDLWAPVRSRVDFTEPTHCDDPVGALLDMGVGILAGCEVVAQINTTIRSDPLLAAAWGRERFAEQSTIARVLDACRPSQVSQMRAANEGLLQWTGHVYQHDFRHDWLRLDIDLTALPASKWAEGSEKGYFPQKKTQPGGNWPAWQPLTTVKCCCRNSIQGAQTSLASLQPVVGELQRLLPFTWAERQRTLIRLDAGFGDDANLSWLLPWGYQVLAKGYSGKRAAAYARRLAPAAWHEIEPGRRWLAWSPVQVNVGWPTRTVAVRWLTPARSKHALYITTLCDLTLTEIADLYDDRGGVEVEIQTDKMGLLLARRRKRRFAAQEMLILLNDWAHNLLAWFRRHALSDSRFADYGPKRIIRDLFTIPGEASIVDDELIELRLGASHPYAAEMTHCLDRLWQVPT